MQALRRLIVPTVVCGCLMLVAGRALYGPLLKSWHASRDRFLQALFVLSMAWLASRLVVAVFSLLAPKSVRGQTPLLLKHLAIASIFGLAGLSILTVVYAVPLSGVLATSSVAGVILGLAFRDTIVDIFAGISLNVERPFSIGDWIHLQGLESKSVIGSVIDINWRTTKLRTTDNVIVVIPNSRIRMMVITNFSLPVSRSRFRSTVCLAYDLPVSRALRVLHAGLMAVDGVLDDPPPKARLNGFREDLGCAEYHLVYWLDPDSTSPQKGRHLVSSSVLSHLQTAGITPHRPQHMVSLARTAPSDADPLTQRARVRILGQATILQDLDEAALQGLARHMQPISLGKGVALATGGETPPLLYVLAEGLLRETTNSEESDTPGQTQVIPVDSFCETAIVSRPAEPRVFVAVTDCLLLALDQAGFQSIRTGESEVARQLVHGIATRELLRCVSGSTVSETGGARLANEQAIADLAQQLWDSAGHASSS